jgi:pimeloyl-ACP methyl ester carboxylesterase
MSEYTLRNLTSSFLPKLSSTNKKKQQGNVMSSNKALLPTTLVTLLLLVCSFSTLGADQTKAEPEYEKFSSLPTYWTPSLSPDGSKISFVQNQIGDDYDDLEARSPYYNAKGIKTPILLVHGEEDRVVPPLHSRYMADELDDYDKVYKYVELESGDHNLSIQRNRHIFFKEMDAFLDQHLRPASKASAATANVSASE